MLFYKKKKIIWISFDFRPENVETLNILTESFFEICVYTLKPNMKSINRGVLNKKIKFNIFFIPLRYFPIITNLLFSLLILMILPFIVLFEKPDYFLIQPDPSILGFIWRPIFKKLGIKIVLIIRSVPVEIINYRRKIYLFWYNISIILAKRNFDGILVVTIHTKYDICTKHNINYNFIGVWGCAVSINIFNPYKTYVENLREKFGLKDKFIILYHGALTFKRGLFETIEGMDLLSDISDKLILFFLGGGEARILLEKIIYEKKMQEKIIIHNPVDYVDVPKYISICDVGIVPIPDIPDYRYQEPLKILEYLAMNKPIIMTDIPAHRNIVGNNECAMWVSSCNSIEISKGIKYAYDHRECIKELDYNCRNIVLNKYDFKNVTKKLENFLLNI